MNDKKITQEENKIEIVSSPHERQHEAPMENVKPTSEEKFLEIVNNAPYSILRDMGFRKWATFNDCVDEGLEPWDKDNSRIITNGPTEKLENDIDIILFPGEWHDIIPKGFVVTGLYGETYAFDPNIDGDDIRFGCLAYGIQRPKVTKKN